jgi:O-succinylbenzoic acid--CoA ligase
VLEAVRPSLLVTGRHQQERLAGGIPVEEGDVLVVLTGGTTGEPKGVVLTAAAVAASAWATSKRLGVDPARDRWLVPLPLAHIGGLAAVTRALLTGTPVEVLPGFDADAVMAAASERGATLVPLVPTTLRRLAAADPGAVERFRVILVGAAAAPSDLPPNAVTTYGMTETGSGVVYDGLPLDGVGMRIAPDGEIAVRSATALRCYRDGTDPKDPEGWLATGDAGEFGADGLLVVHGRISELIVTGGENVWPVAVESVLARHPLVGEVAVAGRPDPEWGERVVAFVVPSGSAGGGGNTPTGSGGGGGDLAGTGGPRRGILQPEGPSLEELRDLVKDELGPWAAPREVVIVTSLARSAAGKLRRDRLRSS